jgi:uncharacterized protein with HEPN domain
MLPEARAYLHDIEQATILIDQFRQRKTLDDYLADSLLRSAVERQLEIIGEVVSKLSRVDPRTAARLKGHRRVIALRNILIHGYASVDDRVIWKSLIRMFRCCKARSGVFWLNRRAHYARRFSPSRRGARTRARYAPV